MMKTSTIFSIAIVLLLGYFMYSISSIMAPFVVSLLIAYLLNPLAKKLDNWGLNRTLVVGFIVFMFMLVIVSIFLKIVPILVDQVQQFIINVPHYREYVLSNVLPFVTEKINQINAQASANLKGILESYSNNFFEYVISIISSFFNSSIAFLNAVALVFFTPILVFYLLKDWSRVVASVDGFIPLIYKDYINGLLVEIDSVLSSYIRGQLNVCLILSTYYVVCLSLLGVNYALLIGIAAGFLIIIPYLGVIIGFIICSVVSLLQFSELKFVYAAIGIFVSGHILESIFITPKLIGDRVGLHPVWLIFALMAAGTIFGFWGMFFAIPVAAVLGVIVRFFLKFYLASNLFKTTKKG